MKRTYREAELEVIKFAANDVIETSGVIDDPEAGKMESDNDVPGGSVFG